MELQCRWDRCEVYLCRGDITSLSVDAIVNAANAGLRGGGGVDGAIHRRGGPAIADECRKIIAERGGPLATGQAVMTPGGNLTARHVIHTVGPVYDRDGKQAAELLASAYRNSLSVARENGLKSIAFPCISTGVYGYPAKEACQVALTVVRQDLDQNGGLDKIIFCTFMEEDYQLYGQNFAALMARQPGG
jgi:O-acetyl-ADP-ribose deacetylase (regulator of RNase III)